MDKNIKILKKNIRDLMNSKKITQNDFAKIIAMNQSDISKYLSLEKDNFFSVEQLIRIADYFEVSIDELSGRNISQFEENSSSFADLIKLIDKLCDTKPEGCEWEISYSPPKPFDCGERYTLPEISLKNCSTLLSDYMNGRQKMYDLVKSGTIDQYLFDLWQKDQFSHYEKTDLLSGEELQWTE